MIPHQRVQERIEWNNKKEVSRSRRAPDHHRRVARKGSKVGQKSEVE